MKAERLLSAAITLVALSEAVPWTQQPRGSTGHLLAQTENTSMDLADILDQPYKEARPAQPSSIETFLAQISATQQNFISHTCSAAHDRSKAELADFYGLQEDFVDSQFPTNDALYWADYASERDGAAQKYEDRITWVRAGAFRPDHHFWGHDGITPRDVIQGAIGDCWFMAAASALAEKPKRLEMLFHGQGEFLNDKGIYAVNLFTLGVKHTVIVDDYLPLQSTQNVFTNKQEYDTLFSHIGEDQSMWGSILEKAMAKFYGNFDHIIGGDPREATRALAGSPSFLVQHDKVTADQLWRTMMYHDSQDNLIFLNTPVIPGRSDDYCGLQLGHAYVVLETKMLSNGARVVKVRNPWGREMYYCGYSDDSPLWTPELRKEAGVSAEEHENEGIFWISIDEFLMYGSSTVISFDTTGWYHDHFLMLDDPQKTRGSWSWCGETCTRHSVEITSDVKQAVYVTANLWEARSYPTECKTPNKLHSIYQQGAKTVDMFKEGTHQMKPIVFEAGDTKTFILEFDWAREGITPDWSVTACAEKGSVSVSHAEGLTSDKLPFLSDEEPSLTTQTSYFSQSTTTINPLVEAVETLVEEIAPEVDELQDLVNDYVLGYDLRTTQGYCGFRQTQAYDEDFSVQKLVFAHNCKSYGALVTIFLNLSDVDRIEREFTVIDEDKDDKVLANERIGECVINTSYATCKFLLRPDNARMGLLLGEGSLGMLTYAASWLPLSELDNQTADD